MLGRTTFAKGLRALAGKTTAFTPKCASLSATAAAVTRAPLRAHAVVATGPPRATPAAAAAASASFAAFTSSATSSSATATAAAAAPAAAVASSTIGGFSSPRLPRGNKTSVMFTLRDEPGALQESLNIFAKHNINLSRLETKPCLHSTDYEFHVDFDGLPSHPNVQALLADLRAQAHQVNILESKKVAWFPRHKRDLDVIANDILAAGSDLDSDHPGFSDPQYRARRAEQTQLALDYRYGNSIPKYVHLQCKLKLKQKIYSFTGVKANL